MIDQQRLMQLERDIAEADLQIERAQRAIERLRKATIDTTAEKDRLQFLRHAQAERAALRIALLIGHANDNSN